MNRERAIVFRYLENKMSRMLCASVDLPYDSHENQKVMKEYKKLHALALQVRR